MQISQQETNTQPIELLPFAGNPRKNMPEGNPFATPIIWNCWTGLDWTNPNRWQARCNPSEPTDNPHPPKHQSQALDLSRKDFESPFKSLVGCVHNVKQAYEQLGKHWVALS
jgi:hypothetical protein